MRQILTISFALILLNFISAEAQAQTEAQDGLSPLQTTKKFSSELRSSPSQDGNLLRKVSEKDKVQVLRSKGEWFEVDVFTEGGTQYRGWLKGGRPIERTAPRLPVFTQKKKKKQLRPLQSKRFHWFWSEEMKNRASASLLVGFQQQAVLSTGLQDSGGTTTRNTAPGFDFGGFDLGVHGNFSLMETSLGSKALGWRLWLAYHYGVLNVTFGNSALGGDSVPTDLEGAAYRITTQNLQAETRVDYTPLSWKDGYGRFFLGLGLFLFEASPDLRETSSGVVFTQIDITALSTRLGAEFQVMNRLKLGGSYAALWLPSYNEDPETAAVSSYSSSNIPHIIQADVSFQLTERWSAQLFGEYFKTNIKQTGTTTRLGNDYEDIQTKISHMKVLLGVGLHF